MPTTIQSMMVEALVSNDIPPDPTPRSTVIDLNRLGERKWLDQNRFRQTASFLRSRKNEISLFDFKNIVIETGALPFLSSSSATYTFTGSYTSTPTAVVTTVDTEGSGLANINPFVSSISTTEMTIGASAQFSGEVHFQIILLE